jgi:hypothetical protein
MDHHLPEGARRAEPSRRDVDPELAHVHDIYGGVHVLETRGDWTRPEDITDRGGWARRLGRWLSGDGAVAIALDVLADELDAVRGRVRQQAEALKTIRGVHRRVIRAA